MATSRRVWGIRAGGDHFDASDIFKKQHQICIGWPATGDLSKLPANRKAIKERLMETHLNQPEITKHQKEQGAGALYRFLYDMQRGDIVVYEDALTSMVYVGMVDGPYRYNPNTFAKAPHLRQVRWKHIVPRGSISSKFSARGNTLWEISNSKAFLDRMED